MGNYIDMMLFASTFATLFVVMDPPGNIPVFIALTGNYDARKQRGAAFQATLTSIIIITVFAIFGRYILQFLNISIPALELSGGVLLFLVAMELLMEDPSVPDANSTAVNVALVPLGTPLLAGPGAIVATMVAVGQAGSAIPGWIAVGAAVVGTHIVMWLFLRFATTLSRILGDGGTLLLTKISGLLLAAIATQMVATAVFGFVDLYTQG